MNQVLRRNLRWWMAIALLSQLAVAALSAQEQVADGRIQLTLPAGVASRTLAQYMRLTNVEILFETKRAKDYRTRAIDGRFTAYEGLVAMTEGTPCEIVPVSQGTAYIVKFNDPLLSSDRPDGASNEPSLPEPKMNSDTHTQKKFSGGLFKGFLAAAAAAVLPHSNAQNNESEEVFELSPFVITAEDTEGYRSRNTLAGTRIKTDLKDLGSAISVVTAEFLEDTGATGVEDLLLYTTGTEIGGPNGNFSGLDFGTDSNSSFTSDDASRISPSSGARVRGIAKPNFTRNYFSTDIAIDAYNTGGITISRGANSLLFGLGSAAGVVENSVAMPQIGENRTKLTHRFGDHGSGRGSIDLTRTLIEGRLAVKVSALDSDTNYLQKPAYIDERRAYFAFNATLFKNESLSWLGKTSLRGNFEFGDSEGTPPKSVTPALAWDSFFIPPPDYSQYNGLEYFNTAAPGKTPTQTFIDAWSKWQLVDTREQADGTPGYRESQTAEGDYPVYSTPIFFNPPVATIQPGGVLTMGLASDPSIAGYRTQSNGNQVSKSGIPYRPGQTVVTRPYEFGVQGGGFRSATLNDRNVFDYRHNLLTGDIDQVTNDFETKTFFLEQALFDGKGGIELAIDSQDLERFSFLPFGTSARNIAITIDTTEYLPTGELNPNAGKPFLSGTGTNEGDRTEFIERENQRAVAYYELDFNEVGDGLGKVLGRHNFTLLMQREEYKIREERRGGFISGVSPNAVLLGTNPIAAGNRKLNSIYYLTEDSLVGKEVGEVRLIPLSRESLLDDGEQYDILFYPYTGGVNGTKFASVNDPRHTLQKATLQYNRWLYDADVNSQKVESRAFAWQSYLLGGHLVGLVGVREDDVTDYSRVRVDPVTGETVLNANGAPNTGAALLVGNELDPRTIDARFEQADPTGKTTTWSVVGHLPQRYLEKLPVSSLSAHYAVSENFQPGESGFDHNGDFVAAPQGETTEYGINIGFANDKWNVRINRFKSAQRFRTASSLSGAMGQSTSQPLGFINDWYDAKLANEGTLTGTPNTDLNFARTVPDGKGGQVPNSSFIILEALDLGFTSYDDVIDTLRNDLLPARVLERLQWGLNAQGDQWVVNGPGADDLKSVQSVDASGYEIELVGNPTKNWRFMANITKVESIPYDSAAAFATFVSEVQQNAKDTNLWDLNTGLDSIVNVNVRIQNWLNNVVNVQAQDNTPVSELAEWRSNVVASYNVSEGRFKGFGAGGAMRYQSGTGIGAELMFADNGLPVSDPDKRFKGPSDTTFDAWISYKRKVLNDRANWKIQLNVRNLFGSEDDIVVYRNPDGQDALFRVAPDVRTWFVTNTLSF